MFKGRQMRELALAYKRTFDSDDGKKVLHDLMKSCHIMTSTFNTDPYETHYNEGARSVILRILKTVNVNMDDIDNMITKLEETEEHYE